MLPLSGGLPARRFPLVNILLIAANFAVFILYELPNLNSAVYPASFYPCTAEGAWGSGAGRLMYAGACRRESCRWFPVPGTEKDV